MFIAIMIVIILLPVAFLPTTLNTFTSSELSEMGVCLEAFDDSSDSAQFQSDQQVNTTLPLIPIPACG